MENLLKQVRVRFSGQENSAEPRSGRERRIPSLKTSSFKEENKRPQNWFRRQFSGQMNQDYDSYRIEQATAVAAAAYAITSLNASSIQEQKKIGKGPELSLTQTEGRRVRLADLFSESGEVTGTATKAKTTREAAAAAPKIKRTLTFTDKAAPSMKKTPTFAESAEPKITAPKPELPPTSKPATPTTRPAIDGTDADAWEGAELFKIQKRYEQMNARILSWENKKKEKAKKRLRKTESGLEQIRSKALKQFRDDMVDIDQIAAGAIAKATERQRDEEFKAREKASTIRKTGKLPRTCFCF